MTSTKKQPEPQKKLRGRPWPRGVSGNPCGRPQGSLNKTTLAVVEGARRAEEGLNRPIMLDQGRHYEVWSNCYIQDGMRFRKDNLQRVNSKGPVPVRPERLNIREVRLEVILGRSDFLVNRDGCSTRTPIFL